MLNVHRNDQTTAGVGAYEGTDTSRRVHAQMRYGTVRKTDYIRGLLRIGIQEAEGGEELLTDWLPWQMLRMGPDRFWWAPEIGEVVFINAPSGEMANAIVIPSCISNQNQDGDKPGLMRIRFYDHALIEYDRDDHHLIVDMAELEGDGPPAIIHLQTTECRVTMSDEKKLIRLESTGNIEIFAGGEVRIISNKDVVPSEQLIEFPDTIPPIVDNWNSETETPEGIPPPFEMPRPEPEGSTTFIELNPET